jgi:hypothetical protein
MNKKYFSSITKVVIATLVILLFSFTSIESNNKIRKIVNSYKMSIFFNLENGKGSEYIMTDSTSIIYKNDIVLYELLGQHYIEETKDTIIYKPTIYSYFIIKKGDLTGRLYKSLNDTKYKIVQTDSLLQKTGFLDNFSKSIKNPYTTLYTTVVNGDEKIEIYNLIKKKYGYADTLKVYYTKRMKNIDFSLAPEIDNKTYKVCKLELTHLTAIDSISKKIIPSSINWFSIKEDTTSNLSKYEEFIDRFIASKN